MGILVLLLGMAVQPAQAQLEDGELPTIDFAVNVMQSAQILNVDDSNPLIRPELDGDQAGFHRVRTGLNLNVQFHERVSALVMIEEETNDFGNSTLDSFSPQIDFAIMDIQLTDGLTFRTGTPVTGLFKFRGYSDGPVVQGNPVIGNSPADIITAGQGVKVLGSYDPVSFDVTVNRGFGESLISEDASGVDIMTNVTYQPTDRYALGFGIARATGAKTLQAANGDGENYNLGGSNASSRETHAALPGETIIQGDAMVNVSDLKLSTWGGYATGEVRGAPVNSALGVSAIGDDAEALYVGVNAKYDVTSWLFVGFRGTLVSNTSDEEDTLAGADFDDHSNLSRFEGSVGFSFFDAAVLKIAGLRQVEGENSFGQVGNNWYGAATELSFAF